MPKEKDANLLRIQSSAVRTSDSVREVASLVYVHIMKRVLGTQVFLYKFLGKTTGEISFNLV